MRRTDVENPWLSRQGPPSSLLLLSFTKMEGRMDGVTELTSWITSNTPLETGQLNLPPPSSLSIALCFSLSLYVFHCRESVSPSFHPDGRTNTALSGSVFSTRTQAHMDFF